MKNVHIETMDWLIWLAIILPAMGLAGYLYGIEAVLVLAIILPLVIIVKNEFLYKQFQWKQEYSVKIASLDDDHKQLLSITLDLFKSLQKVQNKNELAKMLDDLAAYTIYHFEREEGMMKKHAYPALEPHLREHAMMKEKLAEFQTALQNDSIEAAKKLLRFLQEWLVKHINTTDKAYTEFLLSHGEK
ncbi:bacteriohemerythrin [Candidatus Magnetaquicoccus inordinatus]|uniref:bacteriohemerythrin n=1 Tax=Candidatus Magnetaquicoccus inordinatus TaxID=2496818 RepID=UPI00102ADEB6|nr:bacteriohemerythrin [Candidatus Magnetaquicoccus inordinatus]